MPALLSNVELRDVLIGWFADSFGSTPPAVRTDIGSRLEAGDARFQLIAATEVQAVVRQSSIVEAYDSADRYDCEDVAFAARVAIANDFLVTNPRDGVRIPPAFGFLLTEQHALNVGVQEGPTPYLLDVYTNRIHFGRLDGSFLDGFVPDGWLSGIRKVRYVFI